MLNRTVSVDPGLQLQWLQQLLRPERPQEKRALRVQGVRWLDEPKAKRRCAPSDGRSQARMASGK